MHYSKNFTTVTESFSYPFKYVLYIVGYNTNQVIVLIVF